MIFLFPFGGGSTTSGSTSEIPDRWIVVAVTGTATFGMYTPSSSAVTWTSFTTFG